VCPGLPLNAVYALDELPAELAHSAAENAAHYGKN
jgi:hypothetical protein